MLKPAERGAAEAMRGESREVEVDSLGSMDPDSGDEGAQAERFAAGGTRHRVGGAAAPEATILAQILAQKLCLS